MIGFRFSTGHYINWAYSTFAGDTQGERLKHQSVLASYSPAQQLEIGKAFAADIGAYQLTSRLKVMRWQSYPRELYFSAATASKKVGIGLSGDFGFASIDDNYSVYTNSRFLHALGYSLNGDSYSQGKRMFTHASYAINPVVTAFGFYTHAVGTRILDYNQQGFSAGLNFDLKALVSSQGSVF